MISACCWQCSNEHLWMFKSEWSVGLAPRAVCLSFCIKAPCVDLWSNQTPPTGFLLQEKKMLIVTSNMRFRKIVTCISVPLCNSFPQGSPIKDCLFLRKGWRSELNAKQFSMQTMTCTNLAARLAHTCRLRPLCSRQSRHTCSCLCC